jgi:hypothetical protein
MACFRNDERRRKGSAFNTKDHGENHARALKNHARALN